MAQIRETLMKHWRRGRDSNPRYRCQYARLAIWCLRPLGHLSALSIDVETGTLTRL
jgi:hypothetical protein